MELYQPSLLLWLLPPVFRTIESIFPFLPRFIRERAKLWRIAANPKKEPFMPRETPFPFFPVWFPVVIFSHISSLICSVSDFHKVTPHPHSCNVDSKTGAFLVDLPNSFLEMCQIASKHGLNVIHCCAVSTHCFDAVQTIEVISLYRIPWFSLYDWK